MAESRKPFHLPNRTVALAVLAGVGSYITLVNTAALVFGSIMSMLEVFNEIVNIKYIVFAIFYCCVVGAGVAIFFRFTAARRKEILFAVQLISESRASYVLYLVFLVYCLVLSLGFYEIGQRLMTFETELAASEKLRIGLLSSTSLLALMMLLHCQRRAAESA